MQGPLNVVATLDLGGLGPHKSEPVLVEWQWYYHLPSFAGWALIVALLVLVKENRNRQAWLILTPFLLLSEILWPWTERILALVLGNADQYEAEFQWLVVAWTAVWLISPWLARRRPALAFVLALVFAMIVGVVAEFGLYQHLAIGMSLMNYLAWAFALLLAFTLSGLCCQKSYRPRRFLAWLALWLIVGVTLGMACEVGWILSHSRSDVSAERVLHVLPGVAVVSLCTAGTLYLLNVPFMVLAFRCPLYRDRFHKLLRLPEYVSPVTMTSDVGPER